MTSSSPRPPYGQPPVVAPTALQAHLRALLTEADAPARPADFGAWNPFVDELARVPDLPARRAAFDTNARAYPQLRHITNGAASPTPLSPSGRGAGGEGPSVPDLPATAQAIYAHSAPCAQWLDDYLAFATLAAPMTPDSFHLAGALFAGSAAIARRLYLRVANTAIYPNLYLLIVGDSTIYSKTTGLRLVTDIFQAADLEHYLLANPRTPEALLQELSLTVPDGYTRADEDTRHQWLRERALAAQRGWIMDEASALFDAFARDFSAGLMPLLLNLYECPDRITEQTVSRWRVSVQRAYLSYLGAATPAGMAAHLSNPAMWQNGLFARFALILPDAEPRWKFWPPAIEPPPSLPAGLLRIAGLFPELRARIIESEDRDSKVKSVQLDGEAEAHAVQLAAGVWDAWEAYSRATRHELLVAGDVEPDLYGPYGRLGTQAVKVAIILAAFDAETLPVTVQLAHFARAQQIVEGWRASLHRLRDLGAHVQEESIYDRILTRLLDAGADGLLTRDIYRPLHLGAKAAREKLEELQAQGRVERLTSLASNGKTLEVWRYVMSEQSHTVTSV